MKKYILLLSAIFIIPLGTFATSERLTANDVHMRYSDGADIPIADSLYKILDAEGQLNSHDLLRYARVKCLLGDYVAAATIYCRVIASDRRTEHAALTQMEQLFADAEPLVKSKAMARFEKCVFALDAIDTAFYRNRIANFYGRNGLFENEIDMLVKYDMPHESSGRRLADVAKSHYGNRRYRFAATAATAAHGRLEEAEKSAGAFLAYQSYIQIGVRDSALLWLRLSGVANRDARIQTVTLSQDVGHLQDAAALIDSLFAGLPKDTLIVRQHIFTGELSKAREHLEKRQAAWVSNPRERAFWQVRAHVFSGRPADAAPILDTMRFVASWHGASEVLNYRYWLQKLEDDYHALDTWGKLEHNIYTGDLTSAIDMLKKQRLTGEAGEMLVIRLARNLAALSRYKDALEVLELVGGVDKPKDPFGIKGIPGREEDAAPKRSPEYLYFTAEMLNELGRKEDSRALAQRLLKEFPGDVFAQKARILLTRI